MSEKRSGYAPVNGLKMYYEIEGSGPPLIHIPPVFGHAGVKSFPALSRIRSVITVDLQGHGRTEDIPGRPVRFEQHASDVIGLMKHLDIAKADFFGESFGGIVATLIAILHAERVNRVATYGSTFGPPAQGHGPDTLRARQEVSAESRAMQFQRESYERVARDPAYWPVIWEKVFQTRWRGFTRDELSSIKAPFLISLGDHDFVLLEHAVETFRALPAGELAVIPDAGHFALNWEQEKVLPAIEAFFTRPSQKIPFATPATGYHAGETR